MATNYPTAVDDGTSLPDPSAGNFLNSPDHASLHGNANGAIKALEAKVGTGATTPAANKVLLGTGSGTSAWQGLTSAELRGVLSDETGTGLAVFATTPTLTTPKVNTINEETAANGVTIDGLNIKDSALNTNNSVVTANITDAAVTPAKLIAGTGTTWVWQTWSPTITGFSSNPTGGLYYYVQIGKMVMLYITQPNNGTSNATTFTLSLPVTARTIASMQWSGYGQIVDNGTVPSNPGLITVSSAGTTLSVFKDWAGTAFTGSGNKRLASGTVTYEAA